MPLTRVTLIGPPASGKGTQCSVLAQRRGLLHLSTGHLIREEIAAASAIGQAAAVQISRGELVDDETILGLVRAALDRVGWDNFLLDGFPRTSEQARRFADDLAEHGQSLQRVLLLDVPEDLLLERALNRATCPACGHTMAVAGNLQDQVLCPRCGDEMERRDDDNRETFARRMDAYRSQIQPLVEFYVPQGLVSVISAGAASVEEVTERIEQVMDRPNNSSESR